MIQGGWDFVAPAYVVAALGLSAAVLISFLRARHWAKRARDLDAQR